MKNWIVVLLILCGSVRAEPLVSITSPTDGYLTLMFENTGELRILAGREFSRFWGSADLGLTFDGTGYSNAVDVFLISTINGDIAHFAPGDISFSHALNDLFSLDSAFVRFDVNGGETYTYDTLRGVFPVPEPSTLALLALGLAGLSASRRTGTRISLPRPRQPQSR